MPIDREHQDHRRKALIEILAARPMKKQIEIGRALRKQGFKVTQSTVSRDLEALRKAPRILGPELMLWIV